MPDDTRAVAPTSNRDLATMPLDQAIEVYQSNFMAALPSHIPLERFKRTIVTAVNLNSDLAYCDRRSLFNAAVKCAHDGLYPDGREAALIPQKVKIKRRNAAGLMVEMTIDGVRYNPMIQGIRKRMRNTGEVVSAIAEVVYRNDHFRYIKGENPRIEHEPPPLDKERGDPVGAYAIIKLTSGDVIREVMSKAEIERARAVNRSNNPAWVNWWSEMARKTVLRRGSKSAPTGSELDRLLARDDEAPEFTEPRIAPQRPTREQFLPAAAAEETGEILDEDIDGLPAHMMVREEPQEEDEGTPAEDAGDGAGEQDAVAQDAELDPPSRNEFWSQPRYEVETRRRGDKPDWSATQATLLYWVADAQTSAEVHKLHQDSGKTLQGLKLAYVGLYDAVIAAIAERVKVLG